MDSRVLLGVAVRAGVDAVAYTQMRPLGTMSTADRVLPRRLARLSGFQHRLVRPRRLSTALAREWDEHTGGQSADIDRTFYARRQWHPDSIGGPPGTVALRGHMFEVGRCFYWSRLPVEHPGDPDEATEVVCAAFATDSDKAMERAARVRPWLDWAWHNPEPLDWRDRFYWEQRAACWLASIEQGLDLTDFDRIAPANCRLVLESLLAQTPSDRAAGRLQGDLIARMAPRLLTVPINPPDSFLDRSSKRIRRRLFRP
jgi:hypothetical protein